MNIHPFPMKSSIKRFKLTIKYYLRYNGGCTKVTLNKKGKPTEWPYNLRFMKECRKKGKHPHLGRVRKYRYG